MNRAEKRRQRKLAKQAGKAEARRNLEAGRLDRQRAEAIQQSLDFAVQRHQSGQLAEAEAIYRQVLDSDPDQPAALHLLGIMAHQEGLHARAAELISRAISVSPRFAEAHSNLGLVRQAMERPEEAIRHYREALDIRPGFAEAHYNLANALRRLERLEEAAEHYRKVIAINANFSGAHNNLGLVLMDLGQPEEAIAQYRKAIALKGDTAEAHNNLGNAHETLGRLDEASEHYREALRVRPDFAEAHHNLGNTLIKLGCTEKAVSRFRRALDIKPDYADARSNLVFSMYYGDFAPADILEAHTSWNDYHGAWPRIVASAKREAPDPGKQLRVGFVSGDLREHSVSYFLAPLLSAHDRERLSFHCYSNARPKDEDAVSNRLREAADGWRTIAGVDDDAAAELIHADGIDILVDLSGHTKGHRLHVFARKPAPVQATWLGYPGTTGLTAIDYRITDAVADPPGASDQCHVEQLLRLPHGFLCYGPPEEAPEIGAPPSATNGYVTFVSFNNLSKITPNVVNTWARILRAVPRSRLLMKSRSFSCPGARQRFQSLFEQEAIEADRVTFRGRSPAKQDHLAMYGETDIALDSFPYNGTTTTCEAMWMGIPVVVLRGDRHASRVGASLLTQTGLESLIAEDIDEYVDLAVALAGDADRLTSLRDGLRSLMQGSPLCDRQGFAEAMESAFRTMWTTWCSRNGD